MIFLGVLVAIVVAVVLFNQRTGLIEQQLMYFPSSVIQNTPADAGLDYEDVRLTAEDGTDIHGWFIPGERDITWLWFHGNAGNIGDRVGLIQELRAETGVSIFILSYRGYGDSSGSPGESGFYRDAEAAREYLEDHPQVDPDRIVYFGRSIGSAVAVELAARRAPAGLVLESPFPSMRWLARQVYSWLPVWPFLHEQFPVEERASGIEAPALVIHGSDDEIVPVSGGERVAETLAGETDMYIVDGAHHNDVPLVGGPAYYQRIRDFLDRLER